MNFGETDLQPSAFEASEGTLPTRPALRFLTCGSTDDGKSTLIGRLFFEGRSIHEDQLVALERDSKKYGTTGTGIDFALLVDGLEAEREQGTTIDVAYGYFSTKRRSFIVADSPGHERYTRNMVTAASNAELAVILVDARKGLLPQTFRHSIIASLLGIRHVVLAVNKIDLVGYDEKVFGRIESEFKRFASELGFRTLVAIPISARFGDNVSSRSERTAWYEGPRLLEHLENIDVDEELSNKPFRMWVQWVNRAGLEFCGFSGTVASGTVRAGDDVVAAGSGRRAKVNRIVTADGDLGVAQPGDAITIELSEEIDVARGDLLAKPEGAPRALDQFAAHLIWMDDEELLPGRSYLMKIGARTVPASVIELKHRLDVNTRLRLAAKSLHLNEIAFCNLSTTAPIPLDPYTDNRETGGFILIDRLTNATVAAGLIAFGLHRAENVYYHDLTVTKEGRARIKRQRPVILWFTGLSGAGKSTVANLVESRLHARGVHTIMLDGDNLRHGINKDLGFTAADRVENIRRVGEIAKLMTEAGLIALCSFISPFRAERRLVREMVGDGEFLEVFVDTPVDVCIARDPKGLYKRALAGEIKNFTGVDQEYESPENAEIHLHGDRVTPEGLADVVLDELVRRNVCEVI